VVAKTLNGGVADRISGTADEKRIARLFRVLFAQYVLYGYGSRGRTLVGNDDEAMEAGRGGNLGGR
jgi:hypothetical protein